MCGEIRLLQMSELICIACPPARGPRYAGASETDRPLTGCHQGFVSQWLGIPYPPHRMFIDSSIPWGRYGVLLAARQHSLDLMKVA